MKEEAILLNNPELRLYSLHSLRKQLQPYISETITRHTVVPSHYTTCTNCSSYDKSSSSIFSFFSSVFFLSIPRTSIFSFFSSLFSWAFQEQVFFHQIVSWAFQELVFFHFVHQFFSWAFQEHFWHYKLVVGAKLYCQIYSCLWTMM